MILVATIGREGVWACRRYWMEVGCRNCSMVQAEMDTCYRMKVDALLQFCVCEADRGLDSRGLPRNLLRNLDSEGLTKSQKD